MLALCPSKTPSFSFLSSLLPPPSFFPFLSYYTIVNVGFPFIVLTERALALFPMRYSPSLGSSSTLHAVPPAPPPLYCPSLFPSPLVTSRMFSISVSLHFCDILYFVEFLDSEVIPYGICLSLSELFHLTVYVACCCKCQYSILFMGHLLSMPF